MKDDMTIAMARAILAYAKAYRPDGLRHQQNEAHQRLLALARKIDDATS